MEFPKDRIQTARNAARYRRINLALLALTIAASAGALFLVPVLLRIDLGFGWLLGPAALLTNLAWALHHEAIHGGFHPDRRINAGAGRAIAILFGTSFHLLRFTHLMHHRFNRHALDRPDTYDAAVRGRGRARGTFLFQLLIGVYLSEIVAPLLCCLPRPLVRHGLARLLRREDPAIATIRPAAYRLVLEPVRVRPIQVDAALGLAVMAASAILYGPHWPMLVAFLVARGALISIFDNVYHFGTPIDRPEYAYNLAAPTPLRLLFLNMNLHRVHHARPALPWWALPAVLEASGDRCDAPLLLAAAAQFGGPIPIDRLRSIAAETAA
jgi:fatty acid desaturase